MATVLLCSLQMQLSSVWDSAEDSDLAQYCTEGTFIIKPAYGGASRGVCIVNFLKEVQAPITTAYFNHPTIRKHISETVLPKIRLVAAALECFIYICYQAVPSALILTSHCRIVHGTSPVLHQAWHMLQNSAGSTCRAP
jgi:hypothetical protein